MRRIQAEQGRGRGRTRTYDDGVEQQLGKIKMGTADDAPADCCGRGGCSGVGKRAQRRASSDVPAFSAGAPGVTEREMRRRRGGKSKGPATQCCLHSSKASRSLRVGKKSTKVDIKRKDDGPRLLLLLPKAHPEPNASRPQRAGLGARSFAVPHSENSHAQHSLRKAMRWRRVAVSVQGTGVFLV
jgi:hypothetical protein